jgi:hypothetical protein
MEHTEGTLKDTTETKPFIHPHEYEQAGNSYVMAVVAIIAGLPLPIINFFATVGYYLAHRKSAYLVRWHCVQAGLGQLALIPFNSVALAWTIGLVLQRHPIDTWEHDRYYSVASYPGDWCDGISVYYWLYITFVVLLNIAEFIVVIITASRVRKGHNVRWFGIAPIADALTSKEDRNPYKLKS